MQRFNISMDEELVQRLDAFAAERKQNRSAVIRQAVLDYMDAVEKMPALRALMSGFAMQTGAVLAGEISDDEYQVRVDDLERQVKNLAKK